MMIHRLLRWPNIKPALAQGLVFTGIDDRVLSYAALTQHWSSIGWECGICWWPSMVSPGVQTVWQLTSVKCCLQQQASYLGGNRLPSGHKPHAIQLLVIRPTICMESQGLEKNVEFCRLNIALSKNGAESEKFSAAIFLLRFSDSYY